MVFEKRYIESDPSCHRCCSILSACRGHFHDPPGVLSLTGCSLCFPHSDLCLHKHHCRPLVRGKSALLTCPFLSSEAPASQNQTILPLGPICCLSPPFSSPLCWPQGNEHIYLRSFARAVSATEHPPTQIDQDFITQFELRR